MQKRDDRTILERISDAVTHYVGSWRFILSFALILVMWVFLNVSFYFDFIAWDKYPFILLNLFLSFIAAFQAPFIMMSQNRAEKKQDEAYRAIFTELKELVEQDLAMEEEIKTLEVEIKTELSKLIAQQNKLLGNLQQAIALHQLTRQDLAELLEHYEDEEKNEDSEK